MEVDIACFSDTHNKHKAVTLPTCDIAIFSGDATSQGFENELKTFLAWYHKQTQCTFKIFIAGNHDRCFDPKYNEMTHADLWLKDLLAQYPDLIYLENSSVELMGLKIWGSPYTPNFNPARWAFNKGRGDELREIWKQVPLDADIIVTHGPAAYILDYVEQNKVYAGDEDLRFRIDEVKPKLHTFGHIHLESGKLEHKVDDYRDTIHVNASVVNNAYTIIAKPVLIKLEV